MSMKGMQKKYWVLMGFFIVCIRIFSICTKTEQDGTCVWSGGAETAQMQDTAFTRVEQTFQTDREKLHSIALLLREVAQIKEGSLLLKIQDDRNLIYQTSISLAQVNEDEWYEVYLNLPLHKGQIYTLSLEDVWDVGSVKTCMSQTGLPEESIRCKIDGAPKGGQLALRYGYLETYSMEDKLIKCLGSIIAFLVFLFLLFYLEHRRPRAKQLLITHISSYQKWKGALPFLECILCTVLLEACGIQVKPFVKIAFYIVSFISSWNLQKKWVALQKIMGQRFAKAGLICLDVYGAFALTGNRLFIYPLDRHADIWDIARFAIALVWFFPVLITSLYACERMHTKIKCHQNQRSNGKFACLLVLILVIPAGIALYAFNPAISSWDTGCCMSFAHHIRGMQDWHPPIYVCFLKVILSVWDSPYAVVLVQMFFWVFVMLEVFLYLRRRGWHDSALLILALLTACNPANYLHICTIWKDVPYTFALLWLTILLARLVTEAESRQSIFVSLQLVAALFLSGMLRQNGIVPYILSAGAVAVVFYKNRRLLLAVVASIVLLVGVKGPLYHYLDIQPMQKGSAYVGLGQDILGVYYAGGDLSEDTMSMITYMTQGNLAEYSYHPSYAASSPVDISAAGFIKNYLDTWIRNPVMMVKAIICRQDTMVGLFDGQDMALGCVDYTGTVEKDPDWAAFWTANYPRRQENLVTKGLRVVTAFSAANQLTRIMGWRSGLSVLMLLICLFFAVMVRENKKILLIYVPVIGHILSLLLAAGWNEFRYYWPINLATLFICTCILTKNVQERE